MSRRTSHPLRAQHFLACVHSSMYHFMIRLNQDVVAYDKYLEEHKGLGEIRAKQEFDIQAKSKAFGSGKGDGPVTMCVA